MKTNMSENEDVDVSKVNISSRNKRTKRSQKTSVATKSKRVVVGETSQHSLLSQSRSATVGLIRKNKDLLKNNKGLAKKLELSELLVAEQNNRIAQLQWEVSTYEAIKSKLNGVSDKLQMMAGCLDDAASLVSEALDFPQTLPDNITEMSSKFNLSNKDHEPVPSTSSKHTRTVFEADHFQPPSSMRTLDMTMIPEANTEELRIPPCLLQNKDVEQKSSPSPRRSSRKRPGSLTSSWEKKMSEDSSCIKKLSSSPQTPDNLKTPALIAAVEMVKSNIPVSLLRKEQKKPMSPVTPGRIARNPFDKSTSALNSNLLKKPIQGPFKRPDLPAAKPPSMNKPSFIKSGSSTVSNKTIRANDKTTSSKPLKGTSQETFSTATKEKIDVLSVSDSGVNLRRQTFTVHKDVEDVESTKEQGANSANANLRKTFVVSKPTTEALAEDGQVQDDGLKMNTSPTTLVKQPRDQQAVNVTLHDMKDMSLTELLNVEMIKSLPEIRIEEDKDDMMSGKTHDVQPEVAKKDNDPMEHEDEQTVCYTVPIELPIDTVKVVREGSFVEVSRGSGRKRNTNFLDLSDMSFDSKKDDPDFTDTSRKKSVQPAKKSVRIKSSKVTKPKPSTSGLGRKSSFGKPKKSGAALSVYEFADIDDSSVEFEMAEVKTKKRSSRKPTKSIGKGKTLVHPWDKKVPKKRTSVSVPDVDKDENDAETSVIPESKETSKDVNLESSKTTDDSEQEKNASDESKNNAADVSVKTILKSRESCLRRNTKRLTVSFVPQVESGEKSIQATDDAIQRKSKLSKSMKITSKKSLAVAGNENAASDAAKDAPSPPKKLKNDSTQSSEVLKEKNIIVNPVLADDVLKRPDIEIGDPEGEIDENCEKTPAQSFSKEHVRRRRPVSYKEPTLNRKLRRP